MNHKKELLRSLWVILNPKDEPLSAEASLRSSRAKASQLRSTSQRHGGNHGGFQGVYRV